MRFGIHTCIPGTVVVEFHVLHKLKCKGVTRETPPPPGNHGIATNITSMVTASNAYKLETAFLVVQIFHVSVVSPTDANVYAIFSRYHTVQ